MQASFLLIPSREKRLQKRPQAFLKPNYKNKIPLKKRLLHKPVQQPFVLFFRCSLGLLHIGCDLVDLDLCHGPAGLINAA